MNIKNKTAAKGEHVREQTPVLDYFIPFLFVQNRFF